MRKDVIDLSGNETNDSLFDIFIFETEQNIKQLEQITLDNEKLSEYKEEAINEIFRIMHTIKGSSAMMLFNNMSALAHHMENMFSYIRENTSQQRDYRVVSDLVLEGVDFMKGELDKIKTGATPDGEEKALTERIAAYLEVIKNDGSQENAAEKEENSANDPAEMVVPGVSPVRKSSGEKGKGIYVYKAEVFFEDGCQMESIRAFGVICQLQEFAWDVSYFPEDIADSDNSVAFIQEQGLTIEFTSDKDYEEMQRFFLHTPFLRELHLDLLQKAKTMAVEAENSAAPPQNGGKKDEPAQKAAITHSPVTSMISVNVNKLDQLMDLIGEMVIAQAMVINNPELNDLELEDFHKAAQQLRKITGEMQDVIMSVRMIPLTTVFQKNNRIVRDMSKKLNKNVGLQMVGEDTEVDKNIIEHISDPLMHLIRNALDHGIESPEERKAAGKPEQATITLSAWNEGGEVLVSVSDDGRGMDKKKIIASAEKKGLLTKAATEMSDREIYSLIFLPGFSTNEEVTEYSGRGVGMDVVVSNIEMIGGKVLIESQMGKGTKVIMRLPVTLAIIEGMNLRVGTSLYTMAVTDIRESFMATNQDIIKDPDGNEMIMVRGKCYPICRLYSLFDVEPDSKNLDDGILIMVEKTESTVCLFVDELIGQQEVVVKSLPYYIKRIKGLAGCALLGDGRISLILDAANL